MKLGEWVLTLTAATVVAAATGAQAAAQELPLQLIGVNGGVVATATANGGDAAAEITNYELRITNNADAEVDAHDQVAKGGTGAAAGKPRYAADYPLPLIGVGVIVVDNVEDGVVTLVTPEVTMAAKVYNGGGAGVVRGGDGITNYEAGSARGQTSPSAAAEEDAEVTVDVAVTAAGGDVTEKLDDLESVLVSGGDVAGITNSVVADAAEKETPKLPPAHDQVAEGGTGAAAGKPRYAADYPPPAHEQVAEGGTGAAAGKPRYAADYPPPAHEQAEQGETGDADAGENSVVAGGLVGAFEGVPVYHAGVLARMARDDSDREDVMIARAALLPQASASASDTNKEGSDWKAEFGVSQVIFNVPRWRQWGAAKVLAQARAYEAESVSYEHQRQFLVAWLRAQAAADKLGLVAARQRTLRRQYDDAVALREVGRAVKSDALSARSQLAAVGAQRTQARHDLGVAREALRLFVGAEMAVMRLTLRSAALPALPPLAVWEEAILAENLTLRVIERQIAYLREQVRVGEGIVFPRLELFFGGEAGGGGMRSQTFARLNLSQSLYAGGEVAAGQRQYMAQIAQQRYLMLSARRELAREARRFWGQLRANRAQMASLREAAAAADAVLAARAAAYRAGAAVAVDVMRAEEAVFDARLSYRAALYQYLEGWVNLSALAMRMDAGFVGRLAGFFEEDAMFLKGGRADV